MLQTIMNEVTSIFQSTFMSGDWIGLAIAVGAVLVAALIMQRGTQIGSMTLMALILFAFGGYMRGVFHAPAAEDGGASVSGTTFMNQMDASWAQFSGLQAGTLLAYFIAFMLFILTLFALKAMVSRG